MPRPSSFSNGFSVGFGRFSTSAELVIATRNYPGQLSYQNGDVVCGFNRLNIRRTNAEHICWPRRLDGTKLGGLINTGSLLQKYLENIYTYKLSRTSRTTATRLNLVTLEEDAISKNAINQYLRMDVELFFETRRRERKMPMFGIHGFETIYGGPLRLNHTTFDNVWNDIESDRGLLEKDYLRWPASQYELKNFLFVSVDDFTDVELSNILAEDIDNSDPDNPILLKRRKNTFDWENIPNINLSQIYNRNFSVDVRGIKHVRSTYIRAK